MIDTTTPTPAGEGGWHCRLAEVGHRAGMTSHVRGHHSPAHRALLTLIATLLLAIPLTALSALPAQAAGDPVVVDDQTFTITGNESLAVYLKSSGGTDGDVVRWSISGAPSWVSVQPNGYLTGLVPAGGGTFTFAITGTSGTYSGTPVSQDSATATISAAPAAMNIRLGGSDGTERNVIVSSKLKTRFTLNDTVAPDITYTSTAVPPGLSLASNGALTGVLNRVGTFPMTVTVSYRGAVVSKEYTFIGTSVLGVSAGLTGRFPKVTVGRPFTLKLKPIGNIGKTSMAFTGKKPSGYKLKRTSSTTYTLTGKLASRKKVRVPLAMSDQSGAKVTSVLVIAPAPK